MAIAFVNQDHNSTGGGDLTGWVPKWLPASGECVVLVTSNRLSSTPTAVSGFGATWVKVGQSDASAVSVATWVGYNCDGATTSLSATGAGVGNAAYELTGWSGVQTSPSPVDQSGLNTATSTSATTATITPTAAGEVVIGAMGGPGGTAYSAIGGGFTGLTLATSPGPNVQVAYLIQGTAAAATLTYTLAPSTSYASVIVSLKPSASAAFSPLDPMGMAGIFGI